ncbi:MAG: hypothetical protein C4303_01730, partial [candidate division GAL15 bacterium]
MQHLRHPGAHGRSGPPAAPAALRTRKRGGAPEVPAGGATAPAEAGTPPEPAVSALWWAAALSLVPWVELRGSIPVALALGTEPFVAFAVCTAANLLVVPVSWILLDWLDVHWLSRWPWVARQVERVRRRGEGYVRRYAAWGLVLFVALPLPGTGAYAGTLLGWLVG